MFTCVHARIVCMYVQCGVCMFVCVCFVCMKYICTCVCFCVCSCVDEYFYSHMCLHMCGIHVSYLRI